MTETMTFGSVAEMHGLKQSGDGWYGPGGKYGVEGWPDGLFHAVGVGSLSSEIGVTADVAEYLMFSWCPDCDEMQALLDEGDINESDLESVNFVRAWDTYALGAERQLHLLRMQEARS